MALEGNEVERLFRRLVEVLTASGEPGLQDPIEFQDLYQKIIPYRLHRVALRFDTNQDYEMALLRLLSGERGFLEVEPVEVAEALAEEARSINPNPGAFRAYGQAKARLSFRAVKHILESRTSYAPPDHTEAEPTPPKIAQRIRELPFDFAPGLPAIESELALPSLPEPAFPLGPPPATGESCPQCSGQLPQGRVINFCPHCGGNVKVRECPQCGTQLDVSWRHCVGCGYRVT